jgi:benzoyl-CoA reductase/2-hydroxyglutaryl-CoA dehydratase subunit BcrC/BadD/HgdB
MSNSLTLESPRKSNDLFDVTSKSKAVEELRSLAKTYTFAAIEKLVDKGQSAIWGGGSWESPLIRACDTIPIAFMELWRKDSLKAEALAENYYQIPSEFCSMIKAMIGRLHFKKDDKIKRILYFGSTCEPISMVLEHARHADYELHCIDAVTAFKKEDRREELVKFLVDELQKVAIWLTGKPADEDRVRQEIQLKNRALRKVREILDLRLKAPFYLNSASTAIVLRGAGQYFGQPEKYLKLLDDVIVELKEAAKHHVDRFYIPLVLAGGVAGGPLLLKVIEESRGVILGWVIHSTTDFREDIPPLESIAHYLFDAQLKGELGEGAGASATYRRVRVEELVKKTKARGIISSFITGCPYGSVVQGLEREYFKKRGIAFVSLEHTVHSEEPPTEEQITKVKTFIEMLS